VRENYGQEIFPIIASCPAISYNNVTPNYKNYDKGLLVDDIAAFRLNELFKNWANGERLIRSELMISFTTAANTKMNIQPSTPAEAAKYLRRIIRGNDADFSPHDSRMDQFDFDTTPARSVVFKGFGYVRDKNNLEHFRPMLRMEFPHFAVMPIGKKDPHSYLSFHDQFGDDVEIPRHTYQGPSAHEFIRELEKAGQQWALLEFKTENARKANDRNPLQLIKR